MNNLAEQLRSIVENGQYTFLPGEDHSVLCLHSYDVIFLRKLIIVLQAVSESSAARTAVAGEWKEYGNTDHVSSHFARSLERQRNASARRAEAAEANWQAAETGLIAAREQSAGWRCFWCNKLFTNRGEAELHFGAPHSGRMRPECARVVMPTNSTGQVGGSADGATSPPPRGKQPVPVEPEVGEEPAELLASRLIDTWVADKGRKIPWAKAVQIAAIVTKQPDAERDRLLRMGDDNDGKCEMCGRSDAVHLEPEVSSRPGRWVPEPQGMRRPLEVIGKRTPTRLLAAYTPELYEGAYPPYFNITQVGSMVRIMMRGATKADGNGGDTATAVVNVWTLNEVSKAFTKAAKDFECGFDSDPESMA